MRRTATLLPAILCLVTACGDPLAGQPTASSGSGPTTTSTTSSTTTTPTTTTDSEESTTTTRRSSGRTTTTTTSRRSDSGSSGSTRTVDCSDLSGSGTYSDPLQLGVVERPVVAEDCEPLTSGAPFNNRYFIFTLRTAPGSSAKAGARFTLTREKPSSVQPRLIAPNGYILKNAFQGYWTGTEPNFTGRYQKLGDLNPGTYRLGVEKLDSPLRSLTTPTFDVIVDPD